MQRLPDLLFRAERRFGPRPALAIRRGLRTQVWSYEALARAARMAAARLIEAGLTPGDRVLVLAPNSPELVISMFGVWLAGGVLVPIDLRTPADVIARLRERSEPRLLLTEVGVSDATAAAPDGVPTLRVSALAQPGQPPSAPSWLDDGSQRGDELAELVFTSGTTGSPKGVILTHANILANVEAAVDALPIAAGERLLSLLPLSHMLEQTAGLFAPLAAGATIFYSQTLRSSAVQAAMQRHRVGLLVCVPEVLRLLLGGIEREVERSGKQQRWQTLLTLAERVPMPLRAMLFAPVHRRLGGHLRLVLCGGAALSPDVWRTWECLGVRVIQGYGATECAPIVTSNRPGQRLPGTVGWPVKGVEVRIAPDGEVQVRGPNVTPGYWRDAAGTDAAFNDGWYLTGDLGRLGVHGELLLLGRKKDMIVLPDGRNVFPQDVEEELRRQAAIRDCVVVGKPRADGGEEVHAVVILHSTASEEAATAAIRAANAQLAPPQRVSGITVWSELDFPRTPSLKVKRADVLAVVTHATSVQNLGATPVGETLEARVVRLVASAAHRSPADVPLDADLVLDLGMDSLTRVELAVMVEEAFGRSLSDEDMASLHTIRQLVDAIEHGSERGPYSGGSTPLPTWARQGVVPPLRSALQELVLFPMLGLVCHPRHISGKRRIDSLSQPVLLIANHTSHLDAPSVLALLDRSRRERTAVAAAADYFFRGVGRSLIASIALGAFPFHRDGPVAASLSHCGDLVDDGYSVLIFPEGTRSPDGSLQPFKTGIGLLARELGVPVVPVAIDGLHAILPKGRTLPRRGPVRISIGEPVQVDPALSNAAATALLEARLRDLLTGSSPMMRRE
jgi:long-chain acyl-CoA synthetase